MTDPGCSTPSNRPPDGVRRVSLTGVNGQAEPGVACESASCEVIVGGESCFRTGEIERDQSAIEVGDRRPYYLL